YTWQNIFEGSTITLSGQTTDTYAFTPSSSTSPGQFTYRVIRGGEQVDFTVTVTAPAPTNADPTAFTLSTNAGTATAGTSQATDLATINITDPDGESGLAIKSQTTGDFFQLSGTGDGAKLQLIAGKTLEVGTNPEVTLEVTGSQPDQTFTLTIEAAPAPMPTTNPLATTGTAGTLSIKAVSANLVVDPAVLSVIGLTPLDITEETVTVDGSDITVKTATEFPEGVNNQAFIGLELNLSAAPASAATFIVTVDPEDFTFTHGDGNTDSANTNWHWGINYCNEGTQWSQQGSSSLEITYPTTAATDFCLDFSYIEIYPPRDAAVSSGKFEDTGDTTESLTLTIAPKAGTAAENYGLQPTRHTITFTDDDDPTLEATTETEQTVVTGTQVTLTVTGGDGTYTWHTVESGTEESAAISGQTSATYTPTPTATTTYRAKSGGQTVDFEITVTTPDAKATAFAVTGTPVETLTAGPATAQKVADLQITDDGQGTNTIALSDTTNFEIRDDNTPTPELWLKAVTLTEGTLTTTLTLTTSGTTGTDPDPLTYELTVTAAPAPTTNQAPTRFTLSTVARTLAAAASSAETDLATAQITDSDGESGLQIKSQTTGNPFELDGTALKLKAGQTLTAGETLTATLEVTGPLPDQIFTLHITDRADTPVRPVGQTTLNVLQNATPTLTIVGGSGDVQWNREFRGLSSREVAPLASETGPSITIPAAHTATVTAANDGIIYRATRSGQEIQFTVNVIGGTTLTASGPTTIEVVRGTTLPLTVIGGTGAANYLWVRTSPSPPFQIPDEVAATYTLDTTSAPGTSTYEAIRDGATGSAVRITVNVRPSLTYAPTSTRTTTVLQNDHLTLATQHGTGPHGWTKDGVYIEDSTSNSITVDTTTAGTTEYIAHRGTETLPFTVTVLPRPLSPTGSTTRTVPQNAQFTLQVANGYGTYAWAKDGTPIDGETANTLTIDPDTIGTATYTATRGPDTVTFTVTTTGPQLALTQVLDGIDTELAISQDKMTSTAAEGIAYTSPGGFGNFRLTYALSTPATSTNTTFTLTFTGENVEFATGFGPNDNDGVQDDTGWRLAVLPGDSGSFPTSGGVGWLTSGTSDSNFIDDADNPTLDVTVSPGRTEFTILIQAPGNPYTNDDIETVTIAITANGAPASAYALPPDHTLR
ncbi:MAG: hypothetical protein GDA55_06315, partial [Cellvibrionales bacterium]|nr:hypothetical protein [Cellvibrionales bacterium]